MSAGSPASIVTTPSHTPLTWLLLGDKPGDNAQIRVLADALGWPCETRTVRVKPEWLHRKPRVRASLAHVDPARSDRIEPPWPELLITVGRRLSAVALWIQRESLGATKLVLIGKPRQHQSRFDLVVVSSQYRLGPRANVERIRLPLMRVDSAAVREAAAAWRARFAGLRRPLLALLVGGPAKAVRFVADAARAVALGALQNASASGGSLYVCTSRRTPPAVLDAFSSVLPADAPLYRWRAEDPDNPYLALLGLADRFAVTSDSVTMMVEVARLGRPLAIARLPAQRTWIRRLTRSRDLDAVARGLIEQHLAVELGEPWRAPTVPPDDDLERVVARVRALFSLPAGVESGAMGAPK
jgi:mitochondrial fission protein ELM1